MHRIIETQHVNIIRDIKGHVASVCIICDFGSQFRDAPFVAH